MSHPLNSAVMSINTQDKLAYRRLNWLIKALRLLLWPNISFVDFDFKFDNSMEFYLHYNVGSLVHKRLGWTMLRTLNMEGKKLFLKLSCKGRVHRYGFDKWPFVYSLFKVLPFSSYIWAAVGPFSPVIYWFLESLDR